MCLCLDCVLCAFCVSVRSYMDPAERQQVLLVLETKQFLHVLHVTEVWTGRLFRDHDVGQHELIVCLRVRDHQSDRKEWGGGGAEMM